MMTLYSPPMNRLFSEPRKRVIEDIAMKYKGKKILNKSTKRNKRKIN